MFLQPPEYHVQVIIMFSFHETCNENIINITKLHGTFPVGLSPWPFGTPLVLKRPQTATVYICTSLGVCLLQPTCLSPLLATSAGMLL